MDRDPENGKDSAFESMIMGGTIPSNYIPAIEKVFLLVPRSLVLDSDSLRVSLKHLKRAH